MTNILDRVEEIHRTYASGSMDECEVIRYLDAIETLLREHVRPQFTRWSVELGESEDEDRVGELEAELAELRAELGAATKPANAA